MVNWGAIILGAFVGLFLGGIVKDQVCSVSQQDLGTGTAVMKALCNILSNPIDYIILALLIIGLIIYIVKYYKD